MNRSGMVLSSGLRFERVPVYTDRLRGECLPTLETLRPWKPLADAAQNEVRSGALSAEHRC